jgi:hypothetical protein
MHHGGTFSPQFRTEKTNNTGLEYLPYKFNKGANRFISSTTGRFVSTKLGKQAAIIPKTLGIGLNFIETE